jgi:gluconolactonase
MQSDYEILQPRFSSLLLGNCRLEKLYTGTRWAEGPCYFRDGNFLIWSDIPNNRMLRWTEGLGVEVFRQPATARTETPVIARGRLVSCEHLTRRVTRTEWDGLDHRTRRALRRAGASTRPTTSS